MDFTPEKLELLSEECSKLGGEYAEYVHQEKVFQVASSAYLAVLVMKMKEAYPDESNVSLETRARASLEWTTFIKDQVHTLKKAGRAWIKYEDRKRAWETERSLLAQKRELFKHIS